jgi:hypothetical protein
MLSTDFLLCGKMERGYYRQELVIFGADWKFLEPIN